MGAGRKIALGVVGLAFFALAGCATTGGNLTSSAERLERSAAQLARDGRDSSRYGTDARELADTAYDFRRTVTDRRTEDRDIRLAFEELSHDYHSLRDEVDRSESTDARADFRAVTEAYLDVEREMNGRYGRVASDRDDRARF
jgi:outer membrane murein-binding lipoprotein Lpp